MKREEFSESSLRDVQDRLALAALVYAYATAADDRDYEAFKANYTDISSVTVHYPDGRISESLDNREFKGGPVFDEPPPFLRTLHIVTNHRCRIAGDTAIGSCVCVAHHISQDDAYENDLVAHIRYEDSYVRTESGWKFRSRVMRIISTENRRYALPSPTSAG